MAELTPAGYQLKLQNTWFEQERDLYLQIDPNWNLDPSTPDGLKAAHDAEIFYSLDEVLLRAYNSKDPDKARGIDLDAISTFAGVLRGTGTRSDLTVRFYGNVGATVLEGATAESTVTGTKWVSDQPYTILPVGHVDVQMYPQSTGPIPADPGTVTKIVTVMSGITRCTNIEPANLGLDPESDNSLRIKRRRSVGKPGSNQLDSMYAEIVGTLDVRRAAVYNNPTGVATVSDRNPHGLPKNSIACVVDGGSDEDVARSIYVKLNPGPELVSVATKVTERVPSEIRPSHVEEIVFARPSYVDIRVDVKLKGDDFPEGIESMVKDAVMEYAVGSLISPEVGFRSTGFGIGEDVPYSSMYTPINKIVGQYGNGFISELKINGAFVNIPIAYNQLSRWSESNITVTIEP